MNYMIKRFLKISKFFLAVVLISGWIFSGWPQIWETPAIYSVDLSTVLFLTGIFVFAILKIVNLPAPFSDRAGLFILC